MWKTETMWNKSWKYYNRDSHVCEIFRRHVKIILKLLELYMWNFFHTCETIFSCMWNSLVYVKFVFTSMKQCCSVCDIFHTRETILSCMWNFFTHVKQSCYPCKIFPCIWTSCYVCEIFFPTWETVLSCLWIFPSMLTLLGSACKIKIIKRLSSNFKECRLCKK